MERDDFNPTVAGFAAFRKLWPNYTQSIFRDKVEMVTDGYGKILGVTNANKLLCAKVPSSAEGIQVLEVGEKAFREAKCLRSISFADNLEVVGPYAFSETPSLESCLFASSFVDFSEGVFFSSGIRNFVFPKENTSVPSKMFMDASRLSSVTLPLGLEKIGVLSFAGTKSLRSIDLGFRLTEIPDGAFMSSAIESISIPHSVRRIGVSAFSGCINLSSIWYDGSADDFRRLYFGDHWNRGIPSSCTLFIKDKDGLWCDAFKEKEKNRIKKDREEDERVEKALAILEMENLPDHRTLNEKYREMVRKFHPDRISGLDLPKEYTDFASAKFREIHDAYMVISERLGKK